MMVRTPFSIRVAWVTFILVAMTRAAWAQAPQSLEDLMKRMLSAAQANALDEFVAQADPSAKIGMTRQMQDINRELGPRIKQGYVATYWGTRRATRFTSGNWNSAMARTTTS